mgnify:CR=1 FL=1
MVATAAACAASVALGFACVSGGAWCGRALHKFASQKRNNSSGCWRSSHIRAMNDWRSAYDAECRGALIGLLFCIAAHLEAALWLASFVL